MSEEKIYGIVGIALAFIFLILTFRIYFTYRPKRDYNPVRLIARVAIFSAMATILYVVPVFSFNIPIFPSFLSFHFDEIPAFICGFAYGPLSAFFVLLVKTLIKLPMTSTLTVGEWGDLVLSSLYVIPACLIYKYKRNLKGVALGFGVATVIQILGAMVLNVFALVPFYISLYFGGNEAALLSICQKAIPAITDVKWSYGVLAVMPFNALKDAVVIAITFLVYRSIHKVLRFER